MGVKYGTLPGKTGLLTGMMVIPHGVPVLSAIKVQRFMSCRFPLGCVCVCTK